MQCPKCKSDLQKTSRRGIEVDYCTKCKGMWLDIDELDQLEDIAFDVDDWKGTLVFSTSPTEYKCPHCNSPLKRFRYRLYDLELDYCQEHGFWLDEDEDKRVLELMKKRSKDARRKLAAEKEWEHTLRGLRSRPFADKLKDLFR